jgi:hypothetical protein
LNRDLCFLSRKFETIELPREKAYLYKYFKTKVQEAFLKYVHVFGDYAHFSDHTGHLCSFRWLETLYKRLRHLEDVHRQAKQGLDFEKLAIIEKGRYKCRGI